MMNDRVLEMAILVVVIIALLAAILSVSRMVDGQAAALQTAFVSLLGAVIAALITGLKQPPNDSSKPG
jgi:membrane-associated phospholipid phosphatase